MPYSDERAYVRTHVVAGLAFFQDGTVLPTYSWQLKSLSGFLVIIWVGSLTPAATSM